MNLTTKILSTVFSVFFAISSSFATPVLTELVVPQFIGSKSANSTNNTRTPFAVCLQITGLAPNTVYDVQLGIGLVTDAATVYGAGNVWNKNRNSFSGQRDTATFTTDSNGDSGPFWSFLQPTGNGSRFNAGQVHNLRIGFVPSGGAFLSDPDFVGTKQFTALDIPVTERTPATQDNGAFIKGEGLSAESGKYVLIFDNVSGTGNPLSAYQIRTGHATNTSQSELPVLINDVYMQSGTSSTGDFAAVVPVGANNPNGVRRVELRNSDNSVSKYFTDDDGIWTNGMNTTTIARRDVGVLNFFRLNLSLSLEASTELNEKADILIRSAVAPYTVIDSGSVVLDESGYGETSFSRLTNSVNYYLEVKHRNSIFTWSKPGGEIFTAGLLNYDFTSSASQAYGNNLVSVNGEYSIYTGDVDRNEIVDLSDLIQVFNDAGDFLTGYVVTDLNNDLAVDLTDVLYDFNNTSIFIETKNP
ncbi:MAG: hypothetical protein IPL53_07565 [Ignavibacteria bacterium]|nr:hypothetical protein [Ignavibacteria bacterium]